uniref:Uncharacterized protein n=1 Tax=Amphimedon queenslandica TaxID=400682 RepID=A0A1X7V903_AMPQE
MTHTMSHWFRHIAEGEPCDTYLKLSSDDALCVQNLQSIADYIHSAGDLLTRVEEAVERFLYWDEESPSSHDAPVTGGVADEVCHSRDESRPDTTNAHGGNCWSPSRRNIGLDDSISEKWAQASSNCSDAKEYLEMICRDLSDELAQFDLRKEQELGQVFLDLAAGQIEKNEKFVSNNNNTTGGGGGGNNKLFLLEEMICEMTIMINQVYLLISLYRKEDHN